MVERLRAIHRDNLPCDVRRTLRREPRDRMRVILWRRQASRGNHRLVSANLYAALARRLL